MSEYLKKYFPMIRERDEIERELHNNPNLLRTYEEWGEQQQKEFLDYCTGVKGVKILYDSFFKEIMNPENTPERLNELLSLLLGQSVTIRSVLPEDSTRIAEESSLLIMDILVELEDGSLANIEVQKIGYHFPGQRSACYSADLLLRQYKRIKSEKKKAFSYKDIKSVYTIVFFETSTREFHEFPQNYIHKFKQKSDSGLKLELLQKYVFIPLDIFRETHHNNKIKNKTEAWLTFLSADEPSVIIQLITAYPEFKKMYEEIYVMCRNVEKVMEMFSKELLELDKNTVQYMIDEMQETIDNQQSQLKETQNLLEEKQNQLKENQNQLKENQNQLKEKQNQLEEKQKTIDTQQNELNQMKQLLNQALDKIDRLEKNI